MSANTGCFLKHFTNYTRAVKSRKTKLGFSIGQIGLVLTRFSYADKTNIAVQSKLYGNKANRYQM